MARTIVRIALWGIGAIIALSALLILYLAHYAISNATPDVGATGTGNASHRSLTQTVGMTLIDAAMKSYWDVNKTYPKTLSDLVPQYLASLPLDQNGQAYRYNVLAGENGFQLCPNLNGRDGCITDAFRK